MKTKRFLSIIVTVAVVLSLSANAFADFTPMSNPNIASTYGYISKAGNGKIEIHFRVLAEGQMAVLGASSIAIYKSNGSYVTTLSSDVYDNMLSSNTAIYYSSVPYSAESGQTYYAVITFYADSGSTTSTTTYTTASVTA